MVKLWMDEPGHIGRETHSMVGCEYVGKEPSTGEGVEGMEC